MSGNAHQRRVRRRAVARRNVRISALLKRVYADVDSAMLLHEGSLLAPFLPVDGPCFEFQVPYR